MLPQTPLKPEPSEPAIEHPNMQTLVGARDTDLLQVTEWIYKGKYMVAPNMFTCNNLMKERQRELSGCLMQAGLQGKGGQLNCLLGARGAPGILPKIKPWREDSETDVPSWVGEGPVPGEEVDQGDNLTPSLHTSASISPLPLALHDPTLTNGSTTPWKSSS